MAAEWHVDVIDSKPDGSCFYHCIAAALEEACPQIDKSFKRNITSYVLAYLYSINCITLDEMSEEIGDQFEIDASMIRYICGALVDDDDLETYNMMRAADNEKPIRNLKQLTEVIMNTNAFADFVEMRILMTKAFDHRLGIIVFDHTTDTGLVSMPAEWTHNKRYVIMLLREHEHYQLLRVYKNEKDMGTVVDSDCAHAFINEYQKRRQKAADGDE